MNSLVINNSGLNSSAVVAAVGVLAAGLSTLDASANANVRAYGGSTGNVATVVSAYAYQRHNAVLQSGTSVVSGNASAIRQGGYIPKTDFLNTTGSSSNRFIYSYGGSSNSVNTTGTIAPNYYVESSHAQDGRLTSEFNIDALKLTVGRAIPVATSLTGLFVVPRIISVGDLYVITSLDGFAIPAKELGKGQPGELRLAGTCTGVRTAVAGANLQLWGDGPQLVTNDAATLKHVGYLPTTGLTNVAIRKAGTTHYEHCYEDWLRLDIATMSVEPLVFKGAIVDSGEIGVSFTASGIRRATAAPDSTYNLLLGSSLDTERKAGLIALPGMVRLSGPSLVSVTEKPQDIVAVLGTTGTTNAVKIQRANSIGSIDLLANQLQQNVITPATLNLGKGVLTTTAIGERRLLGYGDIAIGLTGTLSVVVFKESYAAGSMSITGAIDPFVMYTVNDTLLGTTGFGFARYVHVSKPADGTTQLLDSGNDYRLAIRGDNSGSVVLSGDLFEVVNLFSRADETRQLVVPPSPYESTYYIKTANLNDEHGMYETTPRYTLHYIEVTQ